VLDSVVEVVDRMVGVVCVLERKVVVISLRWLELSVSGQTVVETAVVAVTTLVDRAGQLVTSAAQLRMVTSCVA
jgi:hypothetical protein